MLYRLKDRQPVLEKDVVLKIDAVHTAVVDGDLGGSASVQRIEQFGIQNEHFFLVAPACYQIIDIRKLPGLGELASALENPVIVDCGDWNIVVDASRNGVVLPATLAARSFSA